jgi:hypothetical protein
LKDNNQNKSHVTGSDIDFSANGDEPSGSIIIVNLSFVLGTTSDPALSKEVKFFITVLAVDIIFIHKNNLSRFGAKVGLTYCTIRLSSATILFSAGTDTALYCNEL